MFITTSFISFTNLLYQMLVVRKLTVSDYGAFNSLLSIFVILAFPLTSLSTMVTKYVSSYSHTGQKERAFAFVSVLIRHMLFFGILVLLVYVFFGYPLKHYLHLNSVIPVYLIAGMLLFTIILTVALGTLQGLEQFLWLSSSNIFGGVLKLGISFLLIRAGWGLGGALGGFLIAQVAAIAITLLPLKSMFIPRSANTDIDFREKYMFVLPAMITVGCISILTNMDVILVKHFFGPVEAGNYSMAQMVGKIALFIPGAIYLVVLPHAAGLHAQQKDSRDILKKALLYTTILCVIFFIVYNLFPGIILKVLCGNFNSDIIILGRLFGCAMAFFSLSIVLVFYQLSVSRFNFIPGFLIMSLLQVFLILFFHATLIQVLFIITANSIITFLLNLKFALNT